MQLVHGSHVEVAPFGYVPGLEHVHVNIISVFSVLNGGIHAHDLVVGHTIGLPVMLL